MLDNLITNILTEIALNPIEFIQNILISLFVLLSTVLYIIKLFIKYISMSKEKINYPDVDQELPEIVPLSPELCRLTKQNRKTISNNKNLSIVQKKLIDNVDAIDQGESIKIKKSLFTKKYKNELKKMGYKVKNEKISKCFKIVKTGMYIISKSSNYIGDSITV